MSGGCWKESVEGGANFGLSPNHKQRKKRNKKRGKEQKPLVNIWFE
jgi:hypothetical protein